MIVFHERSANSESRHTVKCCSSKQYGRFSLVRGLCRLYYIFRVFIVLYQGLVVFGKYIFYNDHILLCREVE